MKPDTSVSHALWRVSLAVSGVVVLALVALSVRSIIVALWSSDQLPVTGSVSVSQEPASPRPAEPTPTPPAATPLRHGSHDFSKDFEIMRQREEAQKETIRILRKEAQENPNAENIPTEEQIRKMEKSGALVM